MSAISATGSFPRNSGPYDSTTLRSSAVSKGDESSSASNSNLSSSRENESLQSSSQPVSKQSVLSQEGRAVAQQLSPAEEKQIAELNRRDAEVKAHERAHKATAGQYAGAVSYTFQVGPDGRRYAIGGEVSIDASPVSGDPQATIDKMTVVKAAALAPADPSTQDRRVASLASRAIQEARQELAALQSEERSEASERSDSTEKRSNREAITAYEGILGQGNENESRLNLRI